MVNPASLLLSYTKKVNHNPSAQLPAEIKNQIAEKCILVILGLTLFTILGNLFDFVSQGNQRIENASYLATDLIVFLFIFNLLHIHRRGNAQFAAILLLLTIITVITISFDIVTLTNIMIVYALPILMSSFLLAPESSFLFAGIATAGYAAAWSYNADGFFSEFSFINISVFFGLAALSWMVARQINLLVSQLVSEENRLKGMITLYQDQDSAMQDIATKTLDQGVQLTHSEMGYLALVNEDETVIHMLAWSEKAMQMCKIQPQQLQYRVSETGLWGEAIRQRRPVMTNDYLEDNPLKKGAPKGHVNLRRHLNVPVFDGKRIVAVMGVANKKEPYNEGDANQLILLANQLWSVMLRRKMIDELERANQELSEAYENTLSGWARALEERNKETQEHSNRVIELATRLAYALQLPEDQLPHFRRGVMLHDIGKMAIPDEILLKKGPLNDQEWDIMRRHPEIAYKILSPIKFLKPALDVPHYHHEKWNGSGYPFGLKGEDIPLTARIFAVVDVWDALTHDRVYHPAWPESQAIDYIWDQAGKYFDPRVVKVFLTKVLGVSEQLLDEKVA